MKASLYKFIFTLMSLSLLAGNGFVCENDHGDISFLHELVQINECHSPELCYNEHAPCHDVDLTQQPAVTTTNTLSSFALPAADHFITFQKPRVDTYQTTLYLVKFPSPILEQLSTVVLTT